jgi:hypothetical protein
MVISSLTQNCKRQQALDIEGASTRWVRHASATQALSELNETINTKVLGHASAKTTVEVYAAPTHWPPKKGGQ